MAKKFRVLILLLVLFFVAADALITRNRSISWERSLWVHIYAINGDDSAAGEAYIRDLDVDDFKPIEAFINAEARRWKLPVPAVEIFYGGHLQQGPPDPPVDGSILQNVWWSLSFRFWSMIQSWEADNSFSDIDLYVKYYDVSSSPRLRHSVGLQGGMIGIINGFADVSYRGSNHFVVVHELFHTLGARDRYGPDSLPVFPDGYAEPYKSPLYPQQLAEIMGGRIPRSQVRADMPVSLKQATVGEMTAREINWVE